MKRKTLAVEEEQYLLSDQLPEEQPLVKKGPPAPAPSPSIGDRIRGLFKPGPPESRVITLSGDELMNKKGKPFVPNVIRNQKYNVFSFIPLCLYEQFKYFINFYYLVISLSQFVPALKVGYVFTYIAPLAFVVCLSMGKEAYDDYKRMVRDKACNSELYYRVCKNGHLKQIPSSDIKVGNIIIVETNRRVPADLLLLRTTEEAGASFLRTDQLDGETDWKLRRAVSITQKLDSNEDIFRLRGRVQAAAPEKDIYRFIGNFTAESEGAVESLSLENTMWASTVVASGQVTGLVLYTGRETRSQMNTSQPPSKVGILDKEINLLTVFLCILQVVLAFILVASSGFKGVWWLDFFLYNILFSNIIPISMKVNMDFAKLVYSFLIMADKDIPGCTVRNTSIPEELGRISYLLSDKTGTLTQNEMEFRRLNLGAISFSNDTLQEITEATIEEYNNPYGDSRKVRKKNSSSVRQALTALALCHNVTPAIAEDGNVQYQASSPDEVALVKFTESVSMTLIDRSFTTMTIRNPLGQPEHFEILNVFPFTSARKRMGIIVRNRETGMIHFYMKGADVIMKKIVEASDWLDEECDRLAREGLRTLVFGQKIFTEEEYEDFARAFKDAETSLDDREAKVDRAIESIEDGLKLLGLTGVEDKLQFQVQETLESLRNAGIKIWMLTGDKRETATCIAISSKLVGRTQEIFQLEASTVAEAKAALAAYSLQLKSSETALIVDGGSLEIFFKHLEQEFFQATQHAPSVVCCRCAPDQKAQVVRMIKFYTKKQTAAIGDGGNDVSMIQAADIGIGIVGKEGRQASLASDFSVDQFSHISTLFLWHGRNSYHRSAVLSQFIIHRGSIITFIQASFSAVFFMSPVTIFTGMLLFGYSCWYTMAPVFCLITDEDASKENVHEFPELYTDLRKGRALSARTFLTWMLLSLYQASIIGFGCVVLGADTYLKFIDLSFTALIAVLLLDVCLVFRKWNVIMIISEVGTFAAYVFCMILFRAYYDIEYISSIGFWWRILVLIVMSFIPPLASMLLYVTFSPPAYKKLEYSV